FSCLRSFIVPLVTANGPCRGRCLPRRHATSGFEPANFFILWIWIAGHNNLPPGSFLAAGTVPHRRRPTHAFHYYSRTTVVIMERTTTRGGRSATGRAKQL